jgi:hypothetical protein
MASHSHASGRSSGVSSFAPLGPVATQAECRYRRPMASPIDVVDNPAEQRYEAVVDGVRARNLHVVPQCPFIAGYIDRHPDYRDLVAVD